ncbi:Arc family DNA-binding protein [Saezia sanguinis]|uniref:Arc family DNA-binding protein n=1 Tax=Saezia sanguinis TaxID=1965230 RepID=UPI0030304130
MNLKDLHNCNMNSKTQPSSYPLRMSQTMREMLENEAKNNGRSLNAEIIARLEQSLGVKQFTPEEWFEIIEKKMQVTVQPGAKFMLGWASIAVENKKFIDENRDLFDQVLDDNPDIAFIPALEEVKRLLRKKDSKKTTGK